MSATASDIDQMLAQKAQGAQGSDIDSMLAARVNAKPQAPAAINPAAGPSKMERFETGVMDPVYGTAQLAEHVATTPLNYLRAGIKKGLEAIGVKSGHGAFIFDQDYYTDTSSEDFDKIVQTREQDYQQSRQAAGQTGIDWARLGGNATTLAATGFAGAPESIGGRIATSMAQGGLAGAASISTKPDDFWWDKAKGVGTGIGVGGATSGLIESVTPLIRAGIQGTRAYFGMNAGNSNAAEAVVNDALNAKGIDPKTVDLNVMAGLKKEAKDAMDSGAEDFTQTGIANRAVSESLPFPLQLTKGMANRDREQFLNEQNLMDIKDIGKPIAQRMEDLNTAATNNLKSFAGNEETNPVTTGQHISETLQNTWDSIQQKKEQLYDAVKNSRGLSATVDGQSAARDIREQLGSPEAMHAWMTLPAHIQNTIHDLEAGKLDLTVSNLQALDKAWGADARAASGSTANAINQAREILNNAGLTDDVGGEAMQAYQLAKQAHSQQMSLIQPKQLNGRFNPNYQPLMKAVVVDGKSPETLFSSGFTNATTKDAAGNLKFLSNLDPEMPKLIGNTYMGEIKRDAINASGIVSNAKLSSYANSPIEMMKMEAVAGKPRADTFKNLASQWNNVKTVPGGVNLGNPSGTAQSVVNTALTVGKGLSKLPIVKQVLREPLMDTVQEEGEKAAVKDALKPGVTLKSMLTTPKQAKLNRAASGIVVPSAIAATQKKDTSNPVGNQD